MILIKYGYVLINYQRLKGHNFDATMFYCIRHKTIWLAVTLAVTLGAINDDFNAIDL